jgi:hypothetical protein
MFDKDGYSILMQSIQSSRSLSRLERGRGREVNFCTLRISSFVRLFTVALLVAVVGLPQQQRHPLLQILFLPPLFSLLSPDHLHDHFSRCSAGLGRR